MLRTLPELIADIHDNSETWENGLLAYEIKIFLWETYDPQDDLIYPIIADWDDLLKATIDKATYCSLSQDEVLSILFGLIHRNRIVEGLWWSIFERGILRKLLLRLSVP